MLRTHGYSLKGKRCYRTHNWGQRGAPMPFGALLGKTLLTVSLFQANVNTDIFNVWIIQDLIPQLPKNSVIIMDNAAFHKGTDMQQAIANKGHTLKYRPTYSPDLNPIEHKWAHAKASL